jgi:hypothetical protein
VAQCRVEARMWCRHCQQSRGPRFGEWEPEWLGRACLQREHQCRVSEPEQTQRGQASPPVGVVALGVEGTGARMG